MRKHTSPFKCTCIGSVSMDPSIELSNTKVQILKIYPNLLKCDLHAKYHDACLAKL